MRLAASVVAWQLGQAFPSARCRVDEPSLELGLPMLLSRFTRPDAARVYVAPDPSAVPLRAHGLLVVCGTSGGASGGAAAAGWKNIVWFDEPQGAESVMNVLLSVFERFDDWNDRLFAMTSANRPVQDLLEASLPLFGNPIVVLDSSFYIVAAAYRTGVHIDWPFEASEGASRLSDKEVGDFFGDVDKRRFSHGIVRSPSGGPSSKPSIALNLFDGEANVGSLSVAALYRDLAPHDDWMLYTLARHVRAALSRPSEQGNDAGRVRFATQLKAMLDGAFVESEELRFQEVIAGFNPTDERLVLAAWRFEMNAGLRQFALRRLAGVSSCLVVFSHDENIVALANLTRARAQGVDLFDTVEQALDSLGLVCGASDEFVDVRQLRGHYRQALAALRYRRKSAETDTAAPRLSRFAEWRLSFPVDACCGDLSPESLYTPGFRALLEYDKAAQVDYLETLSAYLDAGGNAALTARELCITRNSFMGRLERLRAVLGDDDLDDPAMRWHLQLCLRLHAANSA